MDRNEIDNGGRRSLGARGPAGPSRILPVRMSESLRGRISAAAAAAGCNLSEFMRRSASMAAARISKKKEEQGCSGSANGLD